MRLSSYLKELDFNTFRLFYRNNKNFETFILDKGDKSDWIQVANEQRLANSIIDDTGKLNDSFIEILRSQEIEKIRSLTNSETIRIYPNRKYSAYNSAVLFEKDSRIVGGFDLDLKNRVARTITNTMLTVSHEEIESFFQLFESLGVKLFNHYLPPSLTTYSYWTNYEFPFDFFYNAAFDVFETRINTGLMCVNFVHARLEIEPIDERISSRQIQRVQALEDKRYEINKVLKEVFWSHYQTQKNDYGLPELTTQEQLIYLVKAKTIQVPKSDKEAVGIDFQTWDEEHGQTVYYNNNELRFE
jgi:hypothetical protein